MIEQTNAQWKLKLWAVWKGGKTAGAASAAGFCSILQPNYFAGQGHSDAAAAIQEAPCTQSCSHSGIKKAKGQHKGEKLFNDYKIHGNLLFNEEKKYPQLKLHWIALNWTDAVQASLE